MIQKGNTNERFIHSSTSLNQNSIQKRLLSCWKIIADRCNNDWQCQWQCQCQYSILTHGERFFMRIRRIIWRTITTGSSLIAIVNKNKTGLIISTIVNHKTSIQIDIGPFSNKCSIDICLMFFVSPWTGWWRRCNDSPNIFDRCGCMCVYVWMFKASLCSAKMSLLRSTHKFDDLWTLKLHECHLKINWTQYN